MLVMIMGCVGLTLNIISALFLHGKSIQETEPKTPEVDMYQNMTTARAFRKSFQP